MFSDWKPQVIYQQQGYDALHILFFHKNGAINVDFDNDKKDIRSIRISNIGEMLAQKTA